MFNLEEGREIRDCEQEKKREKDGERKVKMGREKKERYEPERKNIEKTRQTMRIIANRNEEARERERKAFSFFCHAPPCYMPSSPSCPNSNRSALSARQHSPCCICVCP
jgi:hypothetical protein